MFAYKLTVEPLPLVDAPRLVDQLAISRPLPVEPIPYVVVAVRVYETTVAIVNIVLELALVDDMVNLLADTRDLALVVELADDVFVISTLAEFLLLVDGLL